MQGAAPLWYRYAPPHYSAFLTGVPLWSAEAIASAFEFARSSAEVTE
jgi:hypothetical protein